MSFRIQVFQPETEAMFAELASFSPSQMLNNFKLHLSCSSTSLRHETALLGGGLKFVAVSRLQRAPSSNPAKAEVGIHSGATEAVIRITDLDF